MSSHPLSTYYDYEETLGIIKADRTVKRITLDQHEVIVPGFLAQDFNVDLKCGHANNFLVQNVLRPLVDKFAVN